MKLIADLVRWIRQPRQPASRDAAAGADEVAGDRTSMADFVRILRMHDEEAGRRNYPG
jgi:hypothetical protein